jgi:hypothetical protein
MSAPMAGILTMMNHEKNADRFHRSENLPTVEEAEVW